MADKQKVPNKQKSSTPVKKELPATAALSKKRQSDRLLHKVTTKQSSPRARSNTLTSTVEGTGFSATVQLQLELAVNAKFPIISKEQWQQLVLGLEEEFFAYQDSLTKAQKD